MKKNLLIFLGHAVKHGKQTNYAKEFWFSHIWYFFQHFKATSTKFELKVTIWEDFLTPPTPKNKNKHPKIPLNFCIYFTVFVNFITPPPSSNSNHMTPSENFLKIWDFPLVFFISELNYICSSALKSPTRTQTAYPRLKNLKWVRGGGG